MRKVIQSCVPLIIILTAILGFFPQAAMLTHTFVASGQVRSDLYTFNYPIKQLLHQSLTENKTFPYWNDLMGGGYPVYAEGQVGALYPFHLLFFSLPLQTFQVFNINLFFSYALGGIFTFLYLKKTTKLSTYSSLLGSQVYMLCGWMISFLQHINTVSVALYFPINLFLIEKLFAIPKKLSSKEQTIQLLGWGSLLSLALFFQLAIGHVESAYHNFLFSGVYFLVRLTLKKELRENMTRKSLFIIFFGIIALLLYSPQLLATVELTKISTREQAITDEASTEIGWPLQSLLLFIQPRAYPLYVDVFPKINGKVIDYAMVYPYIGLIPLFLVVVSLLLLRKNKVERLKDLHIWEISTGICSVLTILYLVGGNTQFFTILRNIVPGLSFFRYPIKALYILEFYLAVFSALGLEVILIKISSAQRAWAKHLKHALPILILIATYLDLRINNQWIQPTIPAAFWLETPPSLQYLHAQNKDCPCSSQASSFQNWRVRSNQIEIKGNENILDWNLQKDLLNTPHVNMNVVNNIMLNESYSGLPIERATRIGAVPNTLDTENETIMLPQDRKRTLELQSVKYITSDIKFSDPDLILIKEFPYKKPYQHLLYLNLESGKNYITTDRAYLYENKDFVPRINLIDQRNARYLLPQDKQASNIFKEIFNADFNPRQQVIIETTKKIDSNAALQDLQASYTIKNYNQNYLKAQVITNNPIYFTISDNYYPGWKARIDKDEVPVEKANFAFRAIPIPPGTHTLYMYYEPTYIKTGLILFSGGATALVLFILLGIFLKVKKTGIITS